MVCGIGIRSTHGHCVGGNGLKIGVKAGVDVFEHVYYATNDELELIQKMIDGLI